MTDFTLPKGKGMFVYKCKHAGENERDAIYATGTAEKVASECKKAGITYVIVKCLDGTWKYNQRPIEWDNAGNTIKWVDDLLQPWVQTLHSAGIQVWGYQYVYLNYPEQEGDAALERTPAMGLDGLYIDAEIEAKKNASKTAKYTARLLNAPFPIGLCSYRYPSLHPELAWRTFLNICDFNAPQVYWEGAHNPAKQLADAYLEHKNILKSNLPFLPVGSAYTPGSSWSATPEDVIAFMKKAETLGFPSVSFWEWYNIKRYLPQNWDAIATYQYGDVVIPEPEPEPEQPPQYSLEEKVERLWNAHKELWEGG
ncbi:MAG: hypothetical protein PHV98_00835 [Candidatus Omnitrophica bacterium]|nr:hypothetical protein [Candidatus Omnitrophota bacterium]